MKSDDREIALVAAIITCYSGNWSGFESLIAAVDDSDPKLRKKAAAQLGDVQFIRHKDRIQTCLLRRLTKETNPAALERVIGSLGTYPSEEVKKRIAPFLKHESELVKRRAELVWRRMRRKLVEDARIR